VEPNPDNLNAAVELIYQIGTKRAREKVRCCIIILRFKCCLLLGSVSDMGWILLPQVLLELLGQIIDQPFYDTLRTQQQLGYIVFSGKPQSC